jgi:predicted transcriptional regulator
MMEMTRITAEVPTETASLVEELARSRGITGAEFVAEAVQRVAEHEADFRAFVQEGIDAADRGDVVPQADVMIELDEMIARHRARCA